jgi:hypothetical protein
VTALADPAMWPLNGLWLVNGVGYLVLMGFAMIRVYRPYLRLIPRETAQLLLIGYAALTIVAWLLMSGMLTGRPPAPLALITKGVEVLLIVTMILYRRSLRQT